jgi:hypothetical protein
MAEPRTYVCVGKDCRRDKCHRDLITALDASGKVTRVPCQDICKGPVAGTVVDGEVEWFKRVRKPSQRRALVGLARDGGHWIPDELASRWVRKRRGKLKR